MKLPARLAALLALLLLVLSPATASAGPAPGGGPAYSTTPGPAGAGPAAADTGVAAVGWSWPLDPPPAVLRVFDPPAKPWLGGHRGVDLQASHDGARVTSPASGTVSFVGVVVDRPVITVDHGNGLRSSFEAVRSDLQSGAAVAEGDVLGWIQPGHCTPAPCIHWGVRRGGTYLNPLEFIAGLRPSVLLPPLDPAPG